ncbi:hypothetical protein [Paenibacillus sp. USDA918EY]|uniref:hypothetical protein n=1 Tax=Paenibacillus sp. USDA918EY TaxID=2689575 RepID=UPI001F1A49F6|nr:hypothetical protein [Paenibacillus sp. USDA918EY]
MNNNRAPYTTSTKGTIVKIRKKFNITRINGTKPINEWLERSIENFAKREYGLTIKVKVVDLVKKGDGALD